MSSITAQQAKLDLKLVPEEKRLEIKKCNRRLNHGKIQRKPTYQVVIDALALTPCYSAFLITADVPEGQHFDALHTDEEIVSFLRELRHTGEINSLNDVVVDHMHQPWRTFAALINKILSRKTTSLDKLRKSKRVKKLVKKSTNAPARGVVIGETPEMSLSKKKEKVDVTRGKGIELLSQVALNEDAQFEEVQRKSMRDFHKTHPSGFGTVTKTAPRNSEDDNNNEQDSSGEDIDQENESDDDKTQSNNENKSYFKHETNESESGSESDHKENEEDKDDEEEVNDEFVKTPSNDSDDKVEGDKDEEIDYTTSQLYNDVDIRLNEPVDTDKFKRRVPMLQ
nr:hypothetical protein [Tanacetum cinerariifolium]